MPQPDSYVWEKFHLAVLGLATSTKSLQDRLADAYNYSLIHVAKENVRDPDLWRQIEAITDAVGGKGNEQTHHVTARLTESEANKLIKEIVAIYDDIARRYRI